MLNRFNLYLLYDEIRTINNQIYLNFSPNILNKDHTNPYLHTNIAKIIKFDRHIKFVKEYL
jgi:hypothetical protein